MRNRFLLVVYPLLLVVFLVYSYSQVDLNLTLNQSPLYLSFQEKLTRLGYFNRPLSTGIYSVLIASLFAIYKWLLALVKKGLVDKRKVLALVLLTFFLLLFSYPAFSHDIFNYIFDARIVWVYRANVWQRAPGEFIGDPMLRFMRWVHRPSVYPPAWIGLSLPTVIFSFEKFVVQLFLMKFLIGFSHLGAVFLIFKILGQVAPQKQLLGTLFFALSPLVLVENLVSAHNDVVMMFFALLSLYLFLRKKWVFSFLSLVLSIGVKYLTGVFLPLWFLGYFLIKKRNQKIDFSLAFRVLAWVSLIIFAVFVFKLEFQPWYLVWVIPFAALAVDDKILVGLTSALSVAGLLRYAPFLYYGHYNPPVPRIKLWLTMIPLGMFFLLVFLFKGRFDKSFRNK